jgi:predicted HTH transcriptional regulator
MPKTEFKTIRQKTEKLLSQSEGSEVEFKEEVGGVEPEHLVAFANSPNGGFLLIGVSETEDNQGQQRGEVDGCDVSDDGKQRIHGQARSCTPTVPIDIYVENTDETAFLRVDIPRGTDRPYCTDSGKYRIREDGRTRALHPPELLELFVEEQAGRFRERFESAASGIESSVEDLRLKVSSKIERLLLELNSQFDDTREMSEELESLRTKITKAVDEIFQSAREAAHLSESANAFAEEAHVAASEAKRSADETKEHIDQLSSKLKGKLSGIGSRVDLLDRKLDSIMDATNSEDPTEDWEKERIREAAESHFPLITATLQTVADSPTELENMIEEEYREYADRMNQRIQIEDDFEDVVGLEEAKRWAMDE